MWIARVSWIPFRISLAAEFQTAATRNTGSGAHREGVILEVRTDSGVVGYGEVSPLPERGDGTARDAEAVLRRTAPLLLGLDLAEVCRLLAGIEDEVGLRAVQCGLDTALLDAEAKSRDLRLAEMLAESPAAAAASVRVNAVIAARRTVDACAGAAQARAAKYSTVKLKVGMEANVEAERARVAAVRLALGPAVALRLDANGAWTEREAITAIRALEPYDLEWVEQPVAAPNVSGLGTVQAAVRTAIAADESVTSEAVVRHLLDRCLVQVLVLKPMLLGGLRPARSLARLAQQAGVQPVITTTIDTGIATTAALHLAASLPPPLPACGLATTSLLADDLIQQPLAIVDGAMQLPDGPGLGIEIDVAALHRFQHGEGGAVE